VEDIHLIDYIYKDLMVKRKMED